MKRVAFAILSLCLLPLVLQAEADYDLLPHLQFQARPELVGAFAPRLLQEPTTGAVIQSVQETASSAYGMEAMVEGGLRWHLQGELAKKRSMIYTAKLPEEDFGQWRYYRLRVRCFGLRRFFPSENKVLTCGETTLLENGHVFNDRRIHTLGGLVDKNMQGGAELKLLLETDNNELSFELLEFSLTNELPGEKETFQTAEASDWSGYAPVDLSTHYNDSLENLVQRILTRRQKLVDYPMILGKKYQDGRTILDWKQGSIPFRFAADEHRNYIAPPSTEGRLAKASPVMGGHIIKNDFFPRARLDEIVIPLSGKTAELYAVLGCDMNTRMKRYAAPDIPYQFADVDCFGIQLDYADGGSEVCFPRHILAGGFVMQGHLASYAIPADKERELKAIRFQNRYKHNHIGLMALTINQGAPLVIGESLRNPPVRVVNQGLPVSESPLSIRHNSKSVQFENAHYLAEFDIDNGFLLRRLENRHAPSMPIQIAPGCFEIQDGTRLLTGKHFRVKKMWEVENGLCFVLECQEADFPARIEMTITGDTGRELHFSTLLVNDSDEDCSCDFRFPAINHLVLGNLEDTYYYFPQNRVVHSNIFQSLHAPANERAFHVQFLDVYNPVAGGGIALHTRDRSMATFDYGLSKRPSGVRVYINNLADWNSVAAHSQHKLVDTVLQFHGGDWHQALAAYQSWLATWFELYPTRLTERWKNAFFYHAESPYKHYSWQTPFYNWETKELFWEESKANTLAYIDHQNDLLGFDFWNCPKDARTSTSNGHNFDDGEYSPDTYFGGAEFLRSFFRKVQNEGTGISLYTIPTYLPKSSPLGQAVGQKVGQVLANGKGLVQDQKVIFPCLAQWQDYYAKAIGRAARELQPDAVYMDCYPFGKYSSTCYSKEHGHEVPQQLNRTQHEMLVKIRKALPEETAFWVEDPAIDYDCAYLNGNITYYCTTIHNHRARSFEVDDSAERDFYPPIQNIQRYTMPHLRQFCFPCGWERSGPYTNEINAVFFNGEGIYDAGWIIFDAHYRPRVRHWLQIQYALVDCFSSHSLEPLVPTAAGEIYANRFPGRNRTVWTLWNGRFATYRGVVLELPYKANAKYYDLWNVQAIEPKREGDKVRLHVSEMAPQGLGCILEYFDELPSGLPTTTVAQKEATQTEPK